MAEVRFEPKLHREPPALHARARQPLRTSTGNTPSARPAGRRAREDYYGTWFGAEARVVSSAAQAAAPHRRRRGQFQPFTSLRGPELKGGLETRDAVEYLDESAPYNFGAGYALDRVLPDDWFRVLGRRPRRRLLHRRPDPRPRGALIFKPVKRRRAQAHGRSSLPRAQHLRAVLQRRRHHPGRPRRPEPRARPSARSRSYSGEVEYSQRFKEDWVALGAGHVSYIENIINTSPTRTPDGLCATPTATSPAITAGGELELRREWRQGWMLSAIYGYQRAQFLDSVGLDAADSPRLVNAPEHLASLRGVVPMVPEIASLGLRTTLEAPRRISSPATTRRRPR